MVLAGGFKGRGGWNLVGGVGRGDKRGYGKGRLERRWRGRKGRVRRGKWIGRELMPRVEGGGY